MAKKVNKVLSDLIKAGYEYLEKCPEGFILVKHTTIIIYNYETDTVLGHYTFHAKPSNS